GQAVGDAVVQRSKGPVGRAGELRAGFGFFGRQLPADANAHILGTRLDLIDALGWARPDLIEGELGYELPGAYVQLALAHRRRRWLNGFAQLVVAGDQ